MIQRNYNNAFVSPLRKIRGKVAHFCATETAEYTSEDRLQSVQIDRIGILDKFFGFGVTHKANIKLIDRYREIETTTEDYFNFSLSIGSEEYLNAFPHLYVSEARRDENTNALSITCYDALYKATAHTVAEVQLVPPYTIKQFAEACAAVLNVDIADITDDSFNTEYADGANFEGTETIHDALNAIAEATQTVYYLDYTNTLVFKRLDKDGAPVLTIGKDAYITLTTRDNRRLSDITHATDLGENLTASTGLTGTNQVIFNNPFWDNREDTAELLENAIAAVGGFTLAQYDVNWRGNYLLEIGDKIALTTKDYGTAYSYLLNDSLTYDGALSQLSNWSYANEEGVTYTNPTTIGEAIKQTYARVDKQEKTITIVASESAENKAAISSIQMNTENITASVESMKTTTEDSIAGITEDIADLKQKAEVAVTPEDVQITIESELANGANKVVTASGFVFDENGLTVSKTDSEITTTITENGMEINKNSTTVLTANNQGVKAQDLHATTYLIIGNNSRFEDYNGRTCCFWIGG